VCFDVEVGPKGLHAVNVQAAPEAVVVPRVEPAQVSRPLQRSAEVAEVMEPETA